MATKLLWNSFLIVFLLPASSFSASISAGLNCPITNGACTCVFNNPFYSLKCNNMSDEIAFRDISDKLSPHVAVLEIGHLNWTYLPMKFLNNASVHTLIVQNSAFHDFIDVEANDLDSINPSSLHHLSLENVTISREWNWDEVKSFKNLQVLFVYNTTVGDTLKSNFSQSINPNISAITISVSNISKVEIKSFEELHNLTYLRIYHSKLTTISRNVFSYPSNLEQLRLDYNEIHTLPCDIFNDMPNLKVVSLSNNTISTLPEEVFGVIWKPGLHIELRDNPIKCDCRLLWTVASETKPDEIIGQCAYPKRLFGKHIKDLTEEDLTCRE